MNRVLVVALGAVALLAGAALGGLTTESPAPPAPAKPSAAEPLVGATLLEGLGNYRFPVTSSHPQVQRWFDQGLMLTFGFNHDAAERSFLKAAQLDPDCAMCWWGAALVLGPHVKLHDDIMGKFPAGVLPESKYLSQRPPEEVEALLKGPMKGGRNLYTVAFPP